MNKNRTIRWLVFGILMLSFSAAAFAQIGVGISVRFGPPPIPVYEQPPCPGPGYLWTPGYWAWSDDDGYYWVPGTWVVAPVGLLWTPGYWGWDNGFYLWHAGYWGPHVGFYGGINYGFGYTGVGFWGGEWRGHSFYYNRSVMNVTNVRITNVYNRTVVVNNYSHVSYNGGEGGISARPTREQERFAHEHHRDALPAQRQQVQAASHNRALFASQNHGRPAIAATARPGDFKGHVVAAREAGGTYHTPAMSPREARAKPGENRQMNNAATRQAEQRNAQPERNAERQNARQQAEQQKSEQRQAQQQKAQQQRVERQQAQQQRAQERQQAQTRQEQQRQQQAQRNEQRQVQQQRQAQQRAERQQAQQQRADQRNAQRQQAQARQQQQAQRNEQRQVQQQRQAQQREQQRPQPKGNNKPEKGPGR
jgi:hypothetical protein